MAKLYSTQAQLIALRGMCSRDRKVSGRLLAGLGEDHFYGDECVEAFNSIMKFMGKNGEPPAYRVLCETVGLSKATRDLLRTVDGMVKTQGEVDSLVVSLSEYRKTRILYEAFTSGLEKLSGKGRVDPEELIEMVQDRMVAAQMNRAVDDLVVHIGRDENATGVIEEIIYGADTDQFIPTGFKTFDGVNGGFIRGSLVTLGGASGAGKSHLTLQLAKNQSMLGYKTVILPLEMSREEMLIRYLANAASIDSLRISMKKLTTQEKDELWAKYHRSTRKIAKAGGCLTVIPPAGDISIEEGLATAHTYNPDAIYIDYAGLLRGADGEDQWRQLGRIARYSKVYAGAHRKVVSLAAQVDDDGRIRYSQAIKEHSSLAFTFVATRESREMGYLNFNMLKGRNQQLISFTLGINYATSTFRDLSPDELQRMVTQASSAQPASGKGGNAKAGVKKRKTFVPDED